MINQKYKVSLGRMYASDSTMCINDKEYLIETLAWNLAGMIMNSGKIDKKLSQRILGYLYKSCDDQLCTDVEG